MKEMLQKLRTERCPTCGQGEVFATKGKVFLLKVPQMRESCTHCGRRYEKEPGYFTGAMFVSYGLCIVEMTALILLFLLSALPKDWLIYAISALVFVLWTFNFRMSRLLWMYIV